MMVESELENKESRYYLCKYAHLYCQSCGEAVGRLILSVPFNLQCLIDRILIDYEDVVAIEAKSMVPESTDFSRVLKFNEVEEFQEKFEIFSQKFSDMVEDTR